jgi:hypothetical protein
LKNGKNGKNGKNEKMQYALSADTFESSRGRSHHSTMSDIIDSPRVASTVVVADEKGTSTGTGAGSETAKSTTIPQPAQQAAKGGSVSDLDRQIEALRRCEYLKESEVKAICAKAREILVDESNVQRVDAPVTVSPYIVAAPFSMLCQHIFCLYNQQLLLFIFTYLATTPPPSFSSSFFKCYLYRFVVIFMDNFMI